MMKYDSKYAGSYYKMTNANVYTLRSDGAFASASVANNATTSVQLTGYYAIGRDGNAMYQTTSGEYIRMADGWEYVAHAPIRYYSAKDAQFYLNKIIKANKKILQNNLFCARFVSKLNEDQQWELYFLQERLQERNNRIVSDGLCHQQQVSSPPGYSLLSNSLDNFMVAMQTGSPVSGVGAVVSTTTIVVAAIIIASLSTAAYFAYKYMAEKAEQDVKYSDELTAILTEKLTDEEYAMLKQETQGIVTKQRILSSIGGGFTALKWVLLAAAGVGAYYLIKKKKGQ